MRLVVLWLHVVSAVVWVGGLAYQTHVLLPLARGGEVATFAEAARRARHIAGHDFAFEQVTIIGDTPLDVDCARACGAVAVAVATGFHPPEDLRACAPDLFFTDFSDVPAALAALTAPR